MPASLADFNTEWCTWSDSVEHAAPDVGAQEPLARADDGVEVRHRSAGREQPARPVRKAHPVAQPVEHVRLELHQRRRRHPDAGVAVGRVGDEVGERRRIDPASGDVGEVAGCGVPNERGMHWSNSTSSSGARSLPCSGAGSRSRRHSSAASTSPQTGCVAREARWARQRATTSSVITRMSCGDISSRRAGGHARHCGTPIRRSGLTRAPTVILSYDRSCHARPTQFQVGQARLPAGGRPGPAAAARGLVRAGEPLPSIRPLAEELRVNRNTVAKAYTELESQGVIETVAGKGCFVRATDSPFKKKASPDSARRGSRPGRRAGASPTGDARPSSSHQLVEDTTWILRGHSATAPRAT